MLNRLIIVVTILALLYLITRPTDLTEEGYYFGPAFNPVRGYFRDYYPRVGTGISNYGLMPPGGFNGLIPGEDFSGFPYQDATNYSAGFGPYRLPYLRNRLRFWDRVARQYPGGRIPTRVPFYRLPLYR